MFPQRFTSSDDAYDNVQDESESDNEDNAWVTRNTKDETARPADITGERSFLTWLLGVLAIATGVYCVSLMPAPTMIPQKIVIGFLCMFLAGWCYVNLLPSRIIDQSRDTNKARAFTTLMGIGLVQFYHPQWLSGNWFGWITPVFPFIMLIVLIGAILKLLEMW